MWLEQNGFSNLLISWWNEYPIISNIGDLNYNTLGKNCVVGMRTCVDYKKDLKKDLFQKLDDFEKQNELSPLNTSDLDSWTD